MNVLLDLHAFVVINGMIMPQCIFGVKVPDFIGKLSLEKKLNLKSW